MANGDLVYHIATPKESASITGNDTFPDGNSPVLVLFGWLGSQDKHLAKYSSIYEDQRYITFRCIPSFWALTIQLYKIPKLAERFLDILYSESFDQHPIIFHIFSNGGALFYQYVILEMQKQNKMLPIKGVIFDSAPHRRTLSTVYNAAARLIGGPSFFNVPITFLTTAFVVMYHDILWPLFNGTSKLPGPVVVDVFWDEEPYNCPHLFIYSKTDEVNPWQEVERFAQIREEKGVAVTKLCFENSPHVLHFSTHREIYIKAVLRFVQTCLNGKYGTEFEKVWNCSSGTGIRLHNLSKL